MLGMLLLIAFDVIGFASVATMLSLIQDAYFYGKSNDNEGLALFAILGIPLAIPILAVPALILIDGIKDEPAKE
ncbi:hypothetical protein EBS80_02910 [bacterium]|nr:hypothetical protein [bacterium]